MENGLQIGCVNMAHQWEPSQVLEPPLALKLIQEQFPELSAVKIRLLGVGWDNTAFIVNEDLIFRFPRREFALALLETEWSVLPELSPRLSLPIPVPEWRGSPSPAFSWPFIGYRMLPGFTACYANLSEKQREDLAEPIARFLSELHATPKSIIPDSPDNRARIDWKVLYPKIMKNFEEMTLLNLIEKRAELETLVEGLQNLRDPITSVLVHGDFYVRHMLLDERHKLAGVIDWRDMHLGDPAIDLAIAHSFLPPSAHARFKKTYGEISKETWDLALLRSIYSSSLIALYGYHSNDPDLLREGLRALKIVKYCKRWQREEKGEK